MTAVPVMQPTAIPSTTGPEERPRALRPKPTGVDRAFRTFLAACAGVVLVLLFAVVVFLAVNSWAAARQAKRGLLTDPVWSPDNHHFGIQALLIGTVAIAIIAIVIAVPVSLATALMINEYAPRRLRPYLTAVVDLLATVPSIVYGFWGLELVSSLQSKPATWVVHWFGFVPIFRTPTAGDYTKSIFACGLIAAVTIVPIVTSVSREVMGQAPRDVCEAALGLGGTRWGMVTDVILPFSKNGIVGATLLGVGRGLGETMIVVLVLSKANIVTSALMGPNGLGSIPKEITDNFAAGSPITKSALVLSGLVLFVFTLMVNMIARKIATRSS